MRKISILIVIYICSNISCLCQDKFVDGTYYSPVIFMEGTRYKFYSDTFETYRACDLGCMTTKGIYKIIGNRIDFFPINPDLLKKSIIKYKKGRENKEIYGVDPYNEFVFHVKYKNDNNKVKFGVWLRDSVDKAIMTLISNGDSLEVFNFNIPQIDILEVGGIDSDKESVSLGYDKQFIGEHIFDILLANDNKHFIREDNYSLTLVNRSKIGFSIIQYGDTIELRHEKYVTDDFINSKIDKSDTIQSNPTDPNSIIEDEIRKLREKIEKE